MWQLPCVPLIPSVAVFACLTLLVANSTKVGWIGCLVLLVFGNSTEFSVFSLTQMLQYLIWQHCTIWLTKVCNELTRSVHWQHLRDSAKLYCLYKEANCSNQNIITLVPDVLNTVSVPSCSDFTVKSCVMRMHRNKTVCCAKVVITLSRLMLLQVSVYCKTLNVCVPFISRISHAKQNRVRISTAGQKIGRNYYSISNYMVLILQNKRGQNNFACKVANF